MARVELLGTVAFSAMAWAGVGGSRWWLAAAWALHPLVWDVLDWFGPGASFAPPAVSIPCITFDLLVAGYVALSGVPALRRAFRVGSLAEAPSSVR